MSDDLGGLRGRVLAEIEAIEASIAERDAQIAALNEANAVSAKRSDELKQALDQLDATISILSEIGPLAGPTVAVENGAVPRRKRGEVRAAVIRIVSDAGSAGLMIEDILRRLNEQGIGVGIETLRTALYALQRDDNKLIRSAGDKRWRDPSRVERDETGANLAAEE